MIAKVEKDLAMYGSEAQMKEDQPDANGRKKRGRKNTFGQAKIDELKETIEKLRKQEQDMKACKDNGQPYKDKMVT